MPAKPHLYALTSLRFFAAFAVVLYHFASEAAVNWPSFLRNIVHNGSAGVPFFFILSGFVLTYTYLDLRTPVGRFWWLRFARIYPTYLLSLLIALPPYLTDMRQAGRMDLLAQDVVSRVFLLQQWLPGQTLRWNGPAWSLSCEAFFYAMFPLALAGLIRLKQGHLVIVAVSLSIYIYFGIGLKTLGLGALLPWADTPIRHLFLFAAGISLAIAYSRGQRFPEWSFWLSGLAVLGMLGSFASLDSAWSGIALCGTFALLIGSAASLEQGPAKKFAGWAPLVLLGEASYSLYILHEPIGSYLHFIAKRLALSFASPAVCLGASALVVAMSVVSYKSLERPLNRALRSWGRRKKEGDGGILDPGAPANR